MKRLLSIMFVLMACSTAFSQSAQNGIVKEYNDAKKKTPLAGVEIVVNNAGSNVSAKNGKFVLSFRTLKPGDKVEVRKIEKAGYEIFNKDALDAWRIANDGSEFTIVLCKSAKFKALKDQYNAVASKSYAQQQKKDEQRLASLLKEGKLQQAEYEKKLKDLKDQYDEQLENLDNYIDRFARIDLETISKEEQKIIEMVKEGKIEEAIKTYEDMHLEEKYAQAVENIIISNNAIAQLETVKAENVAARNEAYLAVKRMNDTRRLQGGRENFEKIRESLKIMAEMDTTNIEAIKEYASYVYEQELFSEAIKWYSILKEKYASDSLMIGKITNDLGNLYSSIGDYEKAYIEFTASIAIRENLCSGDTTQQSKIELIEAYKNYGNLCCYVKKYDECFKAYHKVLLFYKQDVSKYSIDLVYILSNMGNLKTSLRQYSDAEECYEEALGYFKQYAEQFGVSEIGLRTLAQLQCNYAFMEIKYEKYDKADTLLVKGKNNMEQLYKFNPELYSRPMSLCLQYKGMLYEKMNRYVEAEMCYDKSLAIMQQLYDKEPQGAVENLIYLEIDLGLLHRRMQDNKKSTENFMRAYNFYKPLSEVQQTTFSFTKEELIHEITVSGKDTNKKAEILSIINSGIKSSRNTNSLIMDKGTILLYMGDKTGALDCLKQVVKADENFESSGGLESILYIELKKLGLISEKQLRE